MTKNTDKSKGLWSLNPKERKVIVEVEDRPTIELTQPQAPHSPLPWHICTLGENTPNTSNISDVGGSLVARVESYPYRTTGKADAKLIVASVNHAARLASKLLDLANIATHPKATLEQRKTIAREAREALAAYEKARQ